MGPRTILYTGKGGVGKTSVAAATARRAAADGRRTLVLSTDPAHSLGDVLGEPVGPDPTPVAGGLHAQQVDAQTELERHWGGVRAWGSGALAGRGVDRISAQELTVPPGLEELFSLLAIKAHLEGDAYDVVVVDCAPTAETLRLLSFPDVGRWWLERVLPQQGRLMEAARPFARSVLSVELPGQAVVDEMQALVRNLVAMNEILRDTSSVSLRLVMNPDRMVIDEARRTFTYLNLYGFLTDAVVVNRVFPAEVEGSYFGPWRERQQAALADVRSAFAPVPVLTAPFLAGEPIGPEGLDELGDALFAEARPDALLHDAVSEDLVLGHHSATLRLDLPFAEKGDVTVTKLGLELVIRVDAHKRTLLLPPALADYRPAGARLADGRLHVTFDAP